MNWTMIEHLLAEMTETYTRDNLRKITFNTEIFPLMLRFLNNERSSDLYQAIIETEKELLVDIYQ